MSSTEASLHGVRLRCTHCGRPVSETRHTRTSYSVDYYSMHTGRAEFSYLYKQDTEDPLVSCRLVDPVEIVSCVDCYRSAVVRAERDRLFQPENVEGQE